MLFPRRFSQILAGLTAVAGLSVFTIAAQAADENDVKDLKEAALAKFIAEANLPTSKLGQQIAALNKDGRDALNENGVISLPVKSDDLQIIVLSSEVITSPWHYAKLKKNICTTNGVKSGEVLIALKSKSVLSDSEDISTMNYSIRVTVDMSFPLEGGAPAHWNCEAASQNQGSPSGGKMGPISNEMIVSEPQELTVTNAK